MGLIVVSPMRRTMETAFRALDFLIAKGVPVQAHAGWQGERRQQTSFCSEVGGPDGMARSPLMSSYHAAVSFSDSFMLSWCCRVDDAPKPPRSEYTS